MAFRDLIQVHPDMLLLKVNSKRAKNMQGNKGYVYEFIDEYCRRRITYDTSIALIREIKKDHDVDLHKYEVPGTMKSTIMFHVWKYILIAVIGSIITYDPDMYMEYIDTRVTQILTALDLY